MDIPSHPRIRAYFFDMDGTLVDTEVHWSRGLVALAARHGYSCPYELASSWILGRAWSSVVESVYAAWPNFPMSPERLADDLREEYLRIRATSDIRIRDSIECLRALARHTPVAIVSGSQRRDVRDTLRLAGIRREVAFYLGSEDFTHGKPEPDGFLAAARLLGLDPGLCAVFEDSTAGILAGRRAGMMTVALALPDKPAADTAPADIVLRTLADFHPATLVAAADARREQA